MSLAKVLQKVLSNSSPNTVTATSSTNLRVITEEEYAKEVTDLFHYQEIQGVTAALTGIQTLMNDLQQKVSSVQGRQRILIDSGVATNPTKTDEDKLLTTLRKEVIKFKDATVQFDKQLVMFDSLMKMTAHQRGNVMFNTELTRKADFYKDIPKTPGVYKAGTNGGYLEEFIDYLINRENAIKKRLTIMSGPRNATDADLRNQLKVDYWADPASVTTAINLFVANTAARVALMDGTYTDKRNIAQTNNYQAVYSKMPAADTEEAHELTDTEVQALIDAVDAAQGASTASGYALAQALDNYKAAFGAAAQASDVASLGSAQAVSQKAADRKKSIDTIQKYDPVKMPDVPTMPLTDLMALAQRWRDAVAEYERVHMQDPGYYLTTNTGGSILPKLEASNGERQQINTVKKVVNLWTNPSVGDDNDPSNVKTAQKLAVTNDAWEKLCDAREIVLKEAADLFVEKDFPNDLLSSLSSNTIKAAIQKRKPAVTELKIWASGSAYNDIVALPLADMITKTASRKTIVRNLQDHLKTGDAEFIDLLTKSDTKINDWLTGNKLDYEAKAKKINEIKGTSDVYDWKTSGVNGLEDIETLLLQTEQVRIKEIKEYQKYKGQSLPLNFATKSIPEIRAATAAAAQEQSQALFKQKILERIRRAVDMVSTATVQLTSMNKKKDIQDMEDSFSKLLGDLGAYGKVQLAKMVTDGLLTQVDATVIFSAYESAVKAINKVMTDLSTRKQSLLAASSINRRLNAITELNKRFDQRPGIVLESKDVVTLRLNRDDLLKKLVNILIREEKVYNGDVATTKTYKDFEKWCSIVDGPAFLKKYTNIDNPHPKGYIGFIDSFVDSKGAKIKLCGDVNSPFSSCNIGFFHGGVFFSDWARVVPNINGGKVVGAVDTVVKTNLTEMDSVLSDSPASAMDLGKHLTMPMYINLIDRSVQHPLGFISENIEVQKHIVTQSKIGNVVDWERRSQARSQPKPNGDPGDPLMFVFTDEDGTKEDIPLDEVVDAGGEQDEEVTYLIAPSGSIDQSGESVMFKWLKEVIAKGGWTEEGVRKSVQNIIDKLYPDTIYDIKDERTEGATKGGKINFVNTADVTKALKALVEVTGHYKSSLRIIRFVQFDDNGTQIKKSDGTADHKKALWDSKLDIQAFTQISEVTSLLREKGIMVWADVNDLNQYNLGKAQSTSNPGAVQELLDTDDEDVVSFRFTPNI